MSSQSYAKSVVNPRYIPDLQPIYMDDSLNSRQELIEYPDESASFSLNGSDTVTFNVDKRSSLLDMANSYLQIRVTYSAGVGTPIVAFGNGCKGLFKACQYSINNTNIVNETSEFDTLHRIKDLASFDDEDEMNARRHGFYHHEEVSEAIANSRSFQRAALQLRNTSDTIANNAPYVKTFRLPVSELIPLFQQWKLPSTGVQHYMRLTFNTLTAAIYDSANLVTGVTISECTWRIPQLKLSPLAESKFLSAVQKMQKTGRAIQVPHQHWALQSFAISNGDTNINKTIQIPSWRPSTIIVAMQANSVTSNVNENPQNFDQTVFKVTNMNLRVGGEKVLVNDLVTAFSGTNRDWARAYEMFLKLASKDKRGAMIQEPDFDSYSIFVFDLTHLENGVFDPKQSSNNVTVEATLNAAAAGRCFVGYVQDRVVEVRATGKALQYKEGKAI